MSERIAVYATIGTGSGKFVGWSDEPLPAALIASGTEIARLKAEVYDLRATLLELTGTS